MVVRSFNPLSILFHELRGSMIAISIYVVVVSWIDLEFHLEKFNFPIAIVAILGTLIGLLLAFRTNSSYDRWWEARKLWGAIVNDSRTWTRQLISFSNQLTNESIVDPEVKQMAYRQVTFCYTLARELRGQSPMQDVAYLLSAEEAASHESSANVANGLLLRQATELNAFYKAKRIELYQLVELERTLVRLTDSMGGCERIKNTPFPMSYSRMVDALIYLFVLILPLGLFKMSPIGLIGTSLSLAFAFLAIDRVAFFLQDPFSNRASDTPMLSLSRTIEIDIKQMLGETELPEKLEPKNGVLF